MPNPLSLESLILRFLEWNPNERYSNIVFYLTLLSCILLVVSILLKYILFLKVTAFFILLLVLVLSPIAQRLDNRAKPGGR